MTRDIDLYDPHADDPIPVLPWQTVRAAALTICREARDLEGCAAAHGRARAARRRSPVHAAHGASAGEHLGAVPGEWEAMRCQTPGCDRQSHAKGMCHKCYQRKWARDNAHKRPRKKAKATVVKQWPGEPVLVRDPIVCGCGAVVVADPSGLGWEIIAAARANHARFCGGAA